MCAFAKDFDPNARTFALCGAANVDIANFGELAYQALVGLVLKTIQKLDGSRLKATLRNIPIRNNRIHIHPHHAGRGVYPFLDFRSFSVIY